MSDPNENLPKPVDATPPHPLDLYRLAVQHPLAEVAFIEKAWAHYRGDERQPRLLREDFAGTSEVAGTWVQSDPDRQAIAVEIDPITATWAQNAWCDYEDRLQIMIGDVMEAYTPPGDVVVALNFSSLIYHDMDNMLAYLRHGRAMLNDQGLLILDLFGGEGSRRENSQTRTIDPDEGGFEPFNYTWQQAGYDTATQRIDCRIHFSQDDTWEYRDCFRYDWRLWPAGDLLQLAADAGFSHAELWSEDGQSSGSFGPMQAEPDLEEWVGYLVFVA